MARIKGDKMMQLGKNYKLRFTTALALSAILSGCSPAKIVEAVNPVNVYNSAVNYFKGDDLVNPKDSHEKVAEAGSQASSSSFPVLSRVDQQQDYASAREKGGLVADTEGRKYSPAIARQGEPNLKLAAAPVEPPKDPLNKPTQKGSIKSEVPSAQVAAVPIKETELSPGLPTTAEQQMFEERLRKQLAEIRARASEKVAALPIKNVLTSPFLMADNFGTVVVSSTGTETGAQTSPILASKTPNTTVKLLSSSVSSGKLSYLERQPRPIPSGAVKIATIQFANGSTNLTHGDQQILANVRQLQRERGGRLHIVGHASSRTRATDPVRHKMINFKVSVERANAVARELMRLGSKKDQLLVDAVSDTAPIYYEVMPLGEAGNRRAEIYLES